MIRQIVTADQSILRRKLKTVRNFDQSLKSLIQDLSDTLVFANAAGLAANQIGLDAQVFMIGIGPKHQIFINPKVKFLKSEKHLLEEGCLSVPGYRAQVNRPGAIEVTYDDLQGKRRRLRAKGYLARVIQHEYDHLQGKLYIDHILDKKLIQPVTPVRVAFFGSGEFAVPILISLVGLNWTFDFQTVGVVTSPLRPKGRSQELTSTPVQTAASHFSLPILQPEKLDSRFLKDFEKWRANLIVLADYHKLLPAELLAMPKFGGVNLHPSLLPKYRWSTPIQNAILSGDKETGVTLIKMNARLDRGDILAQYKLEISSNDTYLTLRDKLSQLAALVLRDVLPAYAAGNVEPVAQKEAEALNAPIISAELGKVDANDSAEEILRKVRALNPEPGVYSIWKGKRVKILAAHLEKGKLIVDKLQIEGGKPLSWEDFKRGYGEVKFF